MMKRTFLAIILLAVVAGFGLNESHGKVAPGWEKNFIGSQNSPIYLYVDDIDGDGKLDVAVTTDVHPKGSKSEVSWYRNNGEATDWEKTVISSTDNGTDPIFGAAGIIMSDIDGDGKKDAVVVTGNVLNPKGDVYWFKAPEDPAASPWERFTLETGVPDSYFKVYTHDFNADGKQDIVVGGNKGAVMFLNPGAPDQTGAVWTKVSLPAETGSSIFLDDINNDGKIDIINSHTGFKPDYTGNVSWLDVTNDAGQVGFNRTMMDSGLVRAFDVNTFDVNEDGKKDVVVSCFQTPTIYWYEQPANSGDPWIQHLITDTYDGTDLYTGDIDQDGKTDFIISGLFYDKISWFSYEWVNNQVVWTEHILDDTAVFPGDISLNDVDGDGRLDVVVTSMTANQIFWYKNKLDEVKNPCAVEQALGKDNVTALTAIRKFRDKRLGSSAAGTALIEQYYNHTAEITSILAARPLLLAQSRKLIVDLLPALAQAFSKDGRITLSHSRTGEIASLLASINKEASPALQKSIANVLKQLKNGELLKALNGSK
ncbi:MAG: VCBS repeat-containing protein [Pseudomonadota bacterium]